MLLMHGLVLACTAVLAQSAPSAPTAAASAPPAPAAAQQVEISGGRISDTDERRQATASKIVIGREEIEKFGDSTLGEVLRRLPGVTTPGAPGRGGPPRLRGLGSGYTQLLIDGQRVPPGFSLESLTPEQIERIEILRAPTAETGARAIAGTINLVTREGLRRRLNELRLGLGVENGRVSPGAFWTRSDNVDSLSYSLAAGVFRNRRLSASEGEDRTEDLGSGALVQRQTSHTETAEDRRGLHFTGRLQWRLSEAGDTLTLMPSVFASQGTTRRDFTLAQDVPAALPLYDLGHSDSEGRSVSSRLGAQWRQRLSAATRIELDAGLGQWRSTSTSARQEFRQGEPAPLRRLDDDARTRETSGNLSLKLGSLLGGSQDVPGSEHSLVAGAEFEGIRRSDSRVSLQDGAPLLTDFGDNLQASSQRLAAYAQDEWNLTPNWALHAGLRWEGIATRGDAGDGTRPSQRSSVMTPLVHLLWKPDARARDQVRLSLTRSYRAPTTGQLIARPSINSLFPPAGANDPANPDSAGNPGLRPELASGLDLAFERYLSGGGMLGINVFQRHIGSLMRNVTALESVSWSPVPRWVSRPQNIGGASTQGVELEARYRLDQLVAGAPPIELRHNLALYRSRVEGIAGPDNRLDSQAPASANLGADWRLRSLPLTLGGNLNWVPGYRTQLASERSSQVSRKTAFDAYALWTFSPALALRGMAGNLVALDYESRSSFDRLDSGAALREGSRLWGPSYTNWQARLELRL
jgi:iron complex outermembrane receptor protein